MLPDRKKNLIIWIISIVSVVIVILIMYNLAKFMHNRTGQIKVVDDIYPLEYSYYGITIDQDKNYQLTGLNQDYEETILGLRSFYSINKLYYFDNHLVVYSDAINQINYNKADNEFSFYEIDSFYSNKTNVLMNDNYYVFSTSTNVYYTAKDNLNNKMNISDELISDIVLLQDNNVYYLQNDGINVYNLVDKTNKLIVANIAEVKLITVFENYVLYLMDNQLWVYNMKGQNTINVGQQIIDEEGKAFTFVALVPGLLLYEVTDENNNNVLKQYSFSIQEVLKSTMDLQNETILNAFYIEDNKIYVDLSKDDIIRYLIVDYNENTIIKELKNQYVTLMPVEVEKNEN